MALEHVIAAVMVGGLVLYVLGGGADFGGGVWDLLASGPRKEAQRALIEHQAAVIDWQGHYPGTRTTQYTRGRRVARRFDPCRVAFA